MILDNLINSVNMFLSMFDLKLEDKKSNELVIKLQTNSKIDVLSNYGIVGSLMQKEDGYELSFSLDSDKTLTSKIIRNTNEPSRFTFEYKIIDNINNIKLIEGMFSTRKSDGKKILVHHEYSEIGKSIKRRCVFSSIVNIYKIFDNVKGYMMELEDGRFRLKSKEYEILIKQYNNFMYFEIIHKKTGVNVFDDYIEDLNSFQELSNQNEQDIFYGYEIDPKNIDFYAEVNKILNYYVPDYSKYIRKFREKSDKVVSGVFKKTMAITVQSEKIKKIYGLKDDNDPKKDNGGASPVKKISQKAKKRKNKENKES